MSNKLLIFIGPQQPFNIEVVDQIFSSLSGWSVNRLGPGIGAIRQYLVTRGSEELIVRISPDAETVTIDGQPDFLSASVALSLQAGLSEPIRITDMSYNFDLLIGGFGSAEALLSAMSS